MHNSWNLCYRSVDAILNHFFSKMIYGIVCFLQNRPFSRCYMPLWYGSEADPTRQTPTFTLLGYVTKDISKGTNNVTVDTSYSSQGKRFVGGSSGKSGSTKTCLLLYRKLNSRQHENTRTINTVAMELCCILLRFEFTHILQVYFTGTGTTMKHKGKFPGKFLTWTHLNTTPVTLSKALQTPWMIRTATDTFSGVVISGSQQHNDYWCDHSKTKRIMSYIMD